MHPQTPAPVLTLHESRLGEYDPQDPTDLSLLWSVFSKTSRALENGDRLKNISWRLWNRETLCRSRRAAANANRISASAAFDAPTSIPELSSSLESSSSSSSGTSSNADLAAVTPLTSNDDNAPQQQCQDYTDRHITNLDLQHLVQSINTKPDFRSLISSMQASKPINTVPQPVYRRPVKAESTTSTVATASDSFESTDAISDTSISSDGCGSQHSVVRGFTPGTGVTTYTSKTQLAPIPAPILKNSHSRNEAAAKKKTGMFMVGGSSAEEEESFRERMLAKSRTSIAPRESQSSGAKKQTSFKEEVSVMRDRYINNQESEDALESDSEYDPDEDESAAVDDDDAWEDDESEPSHKELAFYRVDSKANLTSRRSAITLNLEEQRAGKSPKALSQSTPVLRRSRTSTPNGPSMPASPTNESSMEQRAAQLPIPKPIIMTTFNTSQIPPLTSPRTTRRNMLAGELSESLRRNMLSERQQKNPLGIHQIKRAHTAYDVTRLSRLPEVPYESSRATDSNDISPAVVGAERKVSWNRYFEHTVGEYNNTGW